MSNAIAATNKQLDDSMILGYLYFYTLGEMTVSHTQLEAIFNRNQIDTKFIRRISPIDAYRRATSNAKQTVVVSFNGEQKKAKVEIDEVACTSTEVIRIVGRKVVDEKNQDLSYETIGKVIFDRKSETVHYNYDYSFDQEYPYMDIISGIANRFFEWTQFHTKDTVRNIISNVLNHMYPVDLMPSGMCKFVPSQNKEMLYSLQNVVRDLGYYAGGCLFETVPVVDTEEMRKTIDTAAMNEVEGEALAFLKEMKDALASKSDLSTRAVTSYIEKGKALEAKVTEYENLLGTYMNFARTQVAEIYRIAADNQKIVA